MRARQTLALIGTTALLASACGGSRGVAPLAADVHQAMLDSLAGSVRTQASIDAAFDPEEFLAMASQFPELGDADVSDDEVQEAQDIISVLDAVAVSFVRGDDDSTGFSLLVNDVPAFAMLFDMGPMNLGSAWSNPFAILQAEPFEASVAARIDADALQAFGELIDEPIPNPGAAIMLAMSEAPFEIPESVADVIDAFVRGEWAGIRGTIDPGAVFDEFGLSEGELTEAMADGFPDGFRPPTRADVVAVLVDSLTFTRIDDLGGQARYEATLHTARFVDGVIGLFAGMDPTGEIERDARRELEGYELRDLEQFLTVTFDGTALTSARVNLLTVLAEMGAHELEDPARGDDFRVAVRGLTQNRLDLVMLFTEHGEVANVFDGVEVTSVSWDELLGLFVPAMMAREFAPPVEFTDPPTMPERELEPPPPPPAPPAPPAPGGST